MERQHDMPDAPLCGCLTVISGRWGITRVRRVRSLNLIYKKLINS